jgi:predicted transport protein
LDHGEIDSAEDEAKILKNDVEQTYKHFKVAFDSITAFEKVMSDAKVLGANIDYQTKFLKAQDLMLKSKFKDTSKIADWCTTQISEVLIRYKEAKHDVDLAKEKVNEVKSWGFSAFETEKILNSAQEALKNHDFESAKSLSKECIDKAQNIRERHKNSLELLQKAKDEVEKIKTRGIETKNMESIISEAEAEFNRGDYEATIDKLNQVFEVVSGLN